MVRIRPCSVESMSTVACEMSTSLYSATASWAVLDWQSGTIFVHLVAQFPQLRTLQAEAARNSALAPSARIAPKAMRRKNAKSKAQFLRHHSSTAVARKGSSLTRNYNLRAHPSKPPIILHSHRACADCLALT